MANTKKNITSLPLDTIIENSLCLTCDEIGLYAVLHPPKGTTKAELLKKVRELVPAPLPYILFDPNENNKVIAVLQQSYYPEHVDWTNLKNDFDCKTDLYPVYEA